MFVSAEREGMVIDLIVNEGLPSATAVTRTPVQASFDGDGYDGGVLVFVDGSRLSALEYWWVTEQKPDVLPPLSARALLRSTCSAWLRPGCTG